MTRPVALVGGGPGDPGLLTLRAEALLAAAQIVVADRPLLPTAALRAPRAQLVAVEEGDGAGAELLAAVAVATGPVVRLYRGDPWLHPAHQREASALRAAGVATEAVPGVATEVALPGLAGVPLHARPVAVTATFARPETAPSPVDPARTLVVTATDVRTAAARLVPTGSAAVVSTAVAVAGSAAGSAGPAQVWRGLLVTAAQCAPAGPGLVVCGAVAALDTTGGTAA